MNMVQIFRCSALMVVTALLIIVPAGTVTGQTMGTETGPIPSFKPLYGDKAHWISATGPVGPEELAAYPELVFEGNWQVEWRGHPEMASAHVWLVKGLWLGSLCSLRGHYSTCRDPLAPWKPSGWRPGPEGPIDHQFHILSSTGEMLEIAHAGGLRSKLWRRPESADEVVGTWKTADGKEGTEIWRRAPPPRIERVTCSYGGETTEGARGAPCRAVLSAAPRPGAMRGNLQSVTVEIYGTGFSGAGPLPVYLNFDRTKIEVGGFCYLYQGDFGDSRQPHGCASWGNPSAEHGDVIGIRAVLNVTFGARTGTKTLWVAGEAVPVHVTVPVDPSEKEATLVSVDTVSAGAPHEPLAELTMGGQYRVQLVFDRPPAHDAEPVTIQDQLSGREFTVSAHPTDHPLLYLTDTIEVGAPQAEGVPE